MSTLAELAEQARLAALEAAEALSEAEREQFTSGARDAVKAVLVHDGQPLTFEQLGMSRVDIDLPNFAVWSDGDVNVAARMTGAGWLVLLAQMQPDGWHRMSEPLDCLAALGSARLSPTDRGLL